MNTEKIIKYILNEIRDHVLHAYSYMCGKNPHISSSLKELDKANKLLGMMIENE